MPNRSKNAGAVFLSEMDLMDNPSRLSSDSETDLPEPRANPLGPLLHPHGVQPEYVSLPLDRHLRLMPLRLEDAREYFKGDHRGTYKDIHAFQRATRNRKIMFELIVMFVDQEGCIHFVRPTPTNSKHKLGRFTVVREGDTIHAVISQKLKSTWVNAATVRLYDANGRPFTPDTFNYIASHPEFVSTMTPPLVVVCDQQRGFEFNSITVVLQTPEGARVVTVKNVPCRGFHHMLKFLMQMFSIPGEPKDYQQLLCRPRRDNTIQVVGPHNLYTTRKIERLGWQLVVQPAEGAWKTKYLHKWGVSEALYRRLSVPLAPKAGLGPGEVPAAALTTDPAVPEGAPRRGRPARR